MRLNMTGGNNTAVGTYSLLGDTIGNTDGQGSGNVAIGFRAGLYGRHNNRLFIDNQNRTDSITQSRQSLITGDFGTDSSVQKVRINGALQVSDGTQSNGYVMTSDANGVASWQTNTPSLGYSVYIALLTEIAPNTSISGSLVPGETYTIDTYNPTDDFSNVATVISGTINTTGCIFLATGDIPADWSNGSALTNSGAPVATVLQNTMGGDVVWSYIGLGAYQATLPMGAGSNNQNTVTFINQTFFDGITAIQTLASDGIRVYTADFMNVGLDSRLSVTSIEIRVY